MTLEQDIYSNLNGSKNPNRSIMIGSTKGRSSSIPSPPIYDNNHHSGSHPLLIGPGSGNRRSGPILPPQAPITQTTNTPTGILLNSNRENGQSARYRSSEDYHTPSGTKLLGTSNSLATTSNKTASSSSSSSNNGPHPSPSVSSIILNQKKHGAHRSQSARVVGSKPKIKRRDVRDIRDYQQHLDLASSEGALRDCQDSYNPFLRKVPSTGRIQTNSGDMSTSSLYSIPQPSVPSLSGGQCSSQFGGSQSQSNTVTNTSPPRDTSPKIIRRQSTAFERRGSDKSTPEKDKKSLLPAIPTINTPESSPIAARRGSTKPTGLPKSPQTVRSTSTRRASSVKGRRNTTFLDVPTDSRASPEDEDEESYRLRTFNVTSKGIVNRGDSFRRRRSRSNSLVPTPATTPELQRNPTFTSSEDGFLLPGGGNEANVRRSPLPTPKSPLRAFPSQQPTPVIPITASPVVGGSSGTEPTDGDDEEHEPQVTHRVAMIGTRGVGKSALVSQFMTSECINAYDRQNDVEGEETVSVMLNGEESQLTFYKVQNPKTDLNRLDAPDAFVVVYSVVDRSSFQKAEQELRRLQEWDFIRNRAVVLVGNKIDLVRSRAVSTQDGRCLAVSFRVKFIEVSVGINHNVDELLVGLLHQIRLKQAQAGNQDSWCKHRGILRASVKARQMLTWLLGKEDAKFKNCENLHVL